MLYNKLVVCWIALQKTFRIQKSSQKRFYIFSPLKIASCYEIMSYNWCPCKLLRISKDLSQRLTKVSVIPLFLAENSYTSILKEKPLKIVIYISHVMARVTFISYMWVKTGSLINKQCNSTRFLHSSIRIFQLAEVD